MVADGLLTRQRYREVPPRVDYELTERSRELMPVIGALARWGYDWTWSAPRADERVEIGAILRTAPGLLSLAKSVKGTVACLVEGERGRDRTYVLTAGGGSVTISELPDDAAASPDARVAGPVSAWVRALGPDADFTALSFSGERALADAVLDGLCAEAASGRQTAAA
jgi:hypothetical protein